MKRFSIFFFCLIAFSTLSAKSKLLLLCGPSGVGKTTLIKRLKVMDSRFKYVSPYITRPLRENEQDKIHISYEKILDLERRGKLVALNNIYGNLYGTPKDFIDEALQVEEFPLIDWPIDKVEMMQKFFGERVVVAYLYPEDYEQLLDQLKIDGRDISGTRFSEGRDELRKFHDGEFSSWIDFTVINSPGKHMEAAKEVYTAYIEACDL